MTSTTGKEGGTGKSGVIVRKAVPMVSRSVDGLIYAAAVICLAGHGRQEQDIQRQ